MQKRPAKSVRPKKRTVGAPILKRNVADLRALAHPIRLRMLELFAERPRTTKQVAELLDQPPTRLYHHVAALERAGLLKLKETRPNRGAVEKWYEAVTRMMGTTENAEAHSPSARNARRAIATTIFEQGKQEVLNTERSTKEPAFVARVVIAAPPEKMPEIRNRIYKTIKAIRDEFECAPGAESVPDDADARWAVTLAFAPVWPKPRPTRTR